MDIHNRKRKLFLTNSSIYIFWAVLGFNRLNDSQEHFATDFYELVRNMKQLRHNNLSSKLIAMGKLWFTKFLKQFLKCFMLF